jgi:DNA-binding NtrC family response regulator
VCNPTDRGSIQWRMAKRILSISYDGSLLWTRQLLLQQMGYSVVSAEGFVAALDACEAPNNKFDLAILGHSIPAKDKERIISHFKQLCDAPILALLRPHEGTMQTATRSIEADPPEGLIAAVREMLVD